MTLTPTDALLVILGMGARGFLTVLLPLEWSAWAHRAVFLGVGLVVCVVVMLPLGLALSPLCDHPPPRTRAAQARFEDAGHLYMQGITTLHRATRSSAPDP